MTNGRASRVSRADAIVGVLAAGAAAALLASAVARVRDHADAMECQNNLCQHPMATLNYVSGRGRLPGLTSGGERPLTVDSLMSAFGRVDPCYGYIPSPLMFRHSPGPAEHYHAHSSVLFKVPGKLGQVHDCSGGLANDLRPWLFRCPADASADNLRDVPVAMPDGSTGYYAAGSYAANGLLPWGELDPAKSRKGSSHILLFGERPQVCRTAAGEEVYNLWGPGRYSPHMPAFATLSPPDPPGMESTGQAGPALPLPPSGEPVPVRVGRTDAEPTLPDFGSPIQKLRGGAPCDPRRPAGLHRAGMQAAMADGTVRVFAAGIDAYAFWAACLPESADSPGVGT